MRKVFQYYVAIWLVLLALFNTIVFLAPGWVGQEKYTSTFWIGYVLITVSFIGQLICSHVAFKEDSAQKMFYGLSLFVISFGSLILSFVVGGACMLISALPYWAAGIICAILLAFNIISVTKVLAATHLVSKTDGRIEEQTFFIRNMTVEAESLMARAKTPEAKTHCKKVYEAFRYSAPMSNEALADIEREIRLEFSELTAAIDEDNAHAVIEIADKLFILLKNRNNKCKVLK